MSDELDELFDDGERAPRPSVRLVIGLGLSGIALAILGLGCSSAPGGLIVLMAWHLAERELDRVEAGYFPASDRPTLRSLQIFVQVLLGLVVLLFILQGTLFCTGFYEVFWGGLLELAVGLSENAAAPTP